MKPVSVEARDSYDGSESEVLLMRDIRDVRQQQLCLGFRVRAMLHGDRMDSPTCQAGVSKYDPLTSDLGGQ